MGKDVKDPSESEVERSPSGDEPIELRRLLNRLPRCIRRLDMMILLRMSDRDGGMFRYGCS